jgi:hypothetical protein
VGVKKSDQLAFMRAEVMRSKRWRQNERYDDLWKRMIDLYRGKHYEGKSRNDRLVVNMVFATKNVIAPAVAVSNPRFVVNARKPESAPQAVVTEEVLNYLWRTFQYHQEFRLTIDDWIVVGHGWIKVGYKVSKKPEVKKVPEATSIESGSDEGIDDREPVEGNVETELEVYEERPFIERISPFDIFVDPDARHPKEMRWIAQRTWRALQDVRVDSRYEAAGRKAASASSASRWDSDDGDGRSGDERPDAGAIQYVEVIEFYDLKRKEVATFCLDGGDKGNENRTDRAFLIPPKEAPYAFCNPFVMARNYEVPDNFYPMGELESIESLQLELNETRNQMLNHRKRYARKYLAAKERFDEEGWAALLSDQDNLVVPLLGDQDPQSSVAPMPAVVTPPDFYSQSELISADIDRVSGVSDYMRGNPEANIRRTATEAAMIQDAANARSQDKLAKVEMILTECGERIIQLMQQFMTTEQVARITGLAGRAWVGYDKDYLKGEFDYEVQGGSTEPRNESFRRQSALQLMDAMAPFIGAGIVNPLALARHVLQNGFGIKDTTSFFDMSQAGMDPYAQEQGEVGPDGQPIQATAGPPGGQPPASPAPGQIATMPPPMALPPGPQAQQPMGGMFGLPDDIPPELLAQLQ